jgi:hypothetical protein
MTKLQEEMPQMHFIILFKNCYYFQQYGLMGLTPYSFQTWVGCVVDKVALGQVFSEYFGFPCQSSFHQFLHNHPHLSSRAGTIGH